MFHKFVPHNIKKNKKTELHQLGLKACFKPTKINCRVSQWRKRRRIVHLRSCLQQRHPQDVCLHCLLKKQTNTSIYSYFTSFSESTTKQTHNRTLQAMYGCLFNCSSSNTKVHNVYNSSQLPSQSIRTFKKDNTLTRSTTQLTVVWKTPELICGKEQIKKT